MIAVASRVRGLRIEQLLALLVGIGIAYTIGYFVIRGHLPPPYFYEPSGTFMDMAAPATYAHNGAAYDSFESIYPPLTFVLIKYLTLGQCHGFNADELARDCDWLGVVSLLAIYAINVVLVVMTYRKLDRRNAGLRSFALCGGLAMTYALERGNVLLFTLTCLLLAYGPLLRSARLRWLFAGLAVNFKVYLIGTIFAQLLRRRWRWFEGAMLATVLVYLVSFALYGAGTPSEIYRNIVSFAGATRASSLLDIWYPSSLLPVRAVLAGDAEFPVVAALGSETVATVDAILGGLTIATTLSIVAAAAASWWRPGPVPMHRLVLLSIGIAAINSEVGGYIQMILIFFVFMERWRGIGRSAAIVMAYMLCIALDVPVENVPPVVRESYLSGRNVIAEFTIGAGIILRPIIVHLILLTLSIVTIRDVWASRSKPSRSVEVQEVAA